MDSREERRRLQAKLATGQVAGVWLQMGSDLDRLRVGLQFLRQQLDAHGCSQLPVYGSVFLPTKQCVSRLQVPLFRPPGAKHRLWQAVWACA